MTKRKTQTLTIEDQMTAVLEALEAIEQTAANMARLNEVILTQRLALQRYKLAFEHIPKVKKDG